MDAEGRDRDVSGVGQMEEEEVGGGGGEGRAVHKMGQTLEAVLQLCLKIVAVWCYLHLSTTCIHTYIHTYICNSSMWVGCTACIVLAASWIQ